MMSPADCIEKADHCLAQAEACADPSLISEWTRLAVHWRNLAADEDSQATMARMAAEGRTAKGGFLAQATLSPRPREVL